MEFHNLLSKMVKARASDLFIKVGSPPSMRIDGRIRFLQDEPTTAVAVSGVSKAAARVSRCRRMS